MQLTSLMLEMILEEAVMMVKRGRKKPKRKRKIL